MGRVKKALLLAFVLCLLCSCGQPELPDSTLFKRVTEESEDTPSFTVRPPFGPM